MLTAAVGGVAFVAIASRYDLQQGRELDLAPSHHWPEPIVHDGVEYEQGPVMICIDYQVVQEDREAFLEAIYALRPARLRDGAFHWAIYEDTAQPGVFVESFMEGSWAEHLRHHERVTRSDVPLQEAVRSFHRGEEPPLVSHYLAATATSGGSA